MLATGEGRFQSLRVNSMWTIQNLLSMEPTTGMDLPPARNATSQRGRNPQSLVHLPPLVRERGKAAHLANRLVSTPRDKSGDEKTQGDKVKTSPQIPVSPPKSIPSSKPLSAIATSTINTAASALAALARHRRLCRDRNCPRFEVRNLLTTNLQKVARA
jgi:hypothetical protein